MYSYAASVTGELMAASQWQEAMRRSPLRKIELSTGHAPDAETSRSYAEILKTLQKEKIVEAASLHLPFAPFDVWQYTAADETERRRTVRRTIEYMKFYEGLGIPQITIHCGGEPNRPEERPEKRARMKQTCIDLLPILKEWNASLNLEFLPRTCIGNTVEELLEITGGLPEKEIGICLDVNHGMNRGKEIPAMIRGAGKRLHTLHLSDYDNVDECHWHIGQGDPAWIGGWTWAVVESGTYDRERKLIRITSRSLGDGEINLVTLIPPETVSLNGKVLGENEFRYSPKSHSLTVPLSEGRNELCIALRKDVPAAPYPALAGKASVTVDLPMSPPPGQMRGHRAINGDLTVGACFPIDLRPFCNMGFDDKVANDGKGGTDDNGDCWLFPKGRTLVRGVPFDFINPAQNGGRSCIVLRSPRKNSFPEKVEHIPVNKVFSRLFFFHGAAYTEPGKTAFRYVLNFEGGKKRILDMKVGEQVAEWKAGAGQDKLEDIEEARAGSLFPAGRPNQWGTGVSGYVYEWRNNVSAEGVTNQDSNQQGLAKLLSIDIVSAGGAVPLVFAITGEE